MKLLNFSTSTLLLGLASLSLIQAGPLISRASAPPPTRPFTVSAYASPYPIGQSITGYNLTARKGNLYLSPKANGKHKIPLPVQNYSDNTSVQKAVLFVSGEGKAYLVGRFPCFQLTDG